MKHRAEIWASLFMMCACAGLAIAADLTVGKVAWLLVAGVFGLMGGFFLGQDSRR